MLEGLFVLMASQLAGEVIARVLGLPLPGPVIGIVLLFVGLLAWSRFRRQPDDDAGPVASTSDALIRNFGVLFVPAGVGITQTYGVFIANSAPVLVSLVVSTILTLLVTVGVFLGARRLSRREADL